MSTLARRRGLALAALASLLFGSVALIGARTGADAQVITPPRETGRLFAAWMPPGEYTAIVVNSNADTREWSITLRSKRGVFPVVVPPHENVVIPFERGWKVDAGDEARLVSEHVPFGEFTELNQLGEDGLIVLSAWGIGPGGPVPFVYREVR